MVGRGGEAVSGVGGRSGGDWQRSLEWVFGRGRLPLWLNGLHADLWLAESRGLINAATRLKSSG